MSEASQPIPEFRHAGRYKPAIPFVTRRAVLQRAKGRCESCGELATLELHHGHYETEGRETPEDLVALCRACHKQRHTAPNGVFYVDPQEMAVEWATFGEGD